MTTEINDEEVIAQVAETLTEKLPNVPRATIDEVVREEFAGFAGRPVRDYLSILTERAARKRLKKLVKSSA